MVLDAQVHLWAEEREDRPWVPGGRARAHSATPFTQGFLLAEMDRTGVDRALLVSPTWEGARNDVVLDAARAHPDRFKAVTRFEIEDRSNAAHFQAWVDSPDVVAARVMFVREWAAFLTDGTADWVWAEAERVGLPLMVYAPRQYAAVGDVARRHPGLALTICHLGLDTSLRDEQIVPEVESLLELASLPNISVKATSLPSFVTEPYPFPTLVPHVRRLVEAFGADRVFWGSDLSRLSCSYPELYRFVDEQLGFLSERERGEILGHAAARWFAWDRSSNVRTIEAGPGAPGRREAEEG